MDRCLIHFSFMSKCVQTSDKTSAFKEWGSTRFTTVGLLWISCFRRPIRESVRGVLSFSFSLFFCLFVSFNLLLWENPCFALCPSGQTSVWFPCNDSVPGPEGEALVEEKVGNIGRDQKASKHTFVSKTVRRALGHLLFCGSNWVSNLVMVI